MKICWRSGIRVYYQGFGCAHGPQRWPRTGWLRCSADGTRKDSPDQRLWIYVLGCAWHIDWTFSRCK